MAYSKAKMKSNSNKTSPCFKPFLIGNMSDKFLPTQTLLYVSVRHIFINPTSFLGITNSMGILYKTSLLNEAVHQFFIDFKKVYDSFRREGLYNILIEFGIPKKLLRLIKMCLTETYSRVRVGKNLSDMFPIRNGLKQGAALSPLLFNFAL